MALMRTGFNILLSALLLAAAPPSRAAEPSPRDLQADEAAEVRAKLATSLFFRGEVADKIIAAGRQERFVDLEGIETYAGVRGALLAWISRHPDKAAEVYLGMKGSGGRVHNSIETREMSWEFNASFLESVKALNAASLGSSVSREAMEMAARRLYGGVAAEAVVPVFGGAAAGAGRTAAPAYADFRLNKGGLEGEIKRAGAWIGAVKPRADRGAAGAAYAAAISAYREFIVAASGVKGRDAVTRQEAVRLETLRGGLRSSLAALALLSRAAELEEAELALNTAAGEPGAREMLSAVTALKAGLEASAARAGKKDLAGLAVTVNSAEDKFAAMYLGFSVYDGLLNLRRRAAPAGFSCLYEYAVFRFLSVFYPASPYPLARAELASAAGGLDAALEKAGKGDLEGALSGLDTARLEAAAATVSSGSAFNRAAQFFSWGLVFRPLELKVTVKGGRPSFRPVLTFFEVMGKNRPPGVRRP